MIDTLKHGYKIAMQTANEAQDFYAQLLQDQKDLPDACDYALLLEHEREVFLYWLNFADNCQASIAALTSAGYK